MKSFARLFLGIAALASATTAFAAGALPDGPYIIATGKATTDAPPDYAVFQFSLQGSAASTEEATAIIGQKSVKVFAVLKAAKISDDDTRASSVNVAPDYEYENDKRVYKGQSARRRFKVTLHDLKNFSEVLQGLLNADVDEMENVDFGSSKEDQIEKNTLDLAIDNARKQADEMAARAGEHVDRIYGLAPGQFDNYMTNEFPFTSSTAQLGKIEVTGTDLAAADRSQAYLIPKSITFTSSVTIICTVRQ